MYAPDHGWEALLAEAKARATGRPTEWVYRDPLAASCGCSLNRLASPGHISRRRFLGLAAGAAGLALTSRLWFPRIVEAQGLDSLPGGKQPRPIAFTRRAPFAPETAIHEIPSGRGNAISTIWDFDGYVGSGAWSGMGTRTNKRTGATTTNPWAGEIRFIQGTYVGVDGTEQRGTFSFI